MTDNAELIAWLRIEADECPSAYHADKFNTCAAALEAAEHRVKEAEAARNELIRNLTAANDDAICERRDAARRERERCAKVCDKRTEMSSEHMSAEYMCDCRGYTRASEHNAEEIRALPDEEK